MGHEQVMDIVTPDGTGWIEIIVATVAYFIVSFLWWGPLMGGKWAKEMGIDMDEKVDMKMPLILQFVGTFLMAYVFWATSHAFTATHDADGLMMQNPDAMAALAGAFFVTLGFIFPGQLGRIAWEKGTWALAGINTAGHFIGLLVMGFTFVLL